MGTARQRRNFAIAAAIFLIIGGVGVVSAIIGGSAINGGTGTRIAVGIGCLICLVLGCVLIAAMRTVSKDRNVTVSPWGLQFRKSKTVSWGVAWAELSSVYLVSVTRRGPRNTPIQMMWIDLTPRDLGGFQHHHPELAPFGRIQPGRYRMGAGTEPTIAGPLANALAYYGGPVFQGFTQG